MRHILRLIVFSSGFKFAKTGSASYRPHYNTPQSKWYSLLAWRNSLFKERENICPVCLNTRSLNPEIYWIINGLIGHHVTLDTLCILQGSDQLSIKVNNQ